MVSYFLTEKSLQLHVFSLLGNYENYVTWRVAVTYNG